MTIIHHSTLSSLHPLSTPHQHVNNIIDSIFTAKRIIFILGAGISTSIGIPDFRSPGGLYERAKSKSNLKNGKDFFSNSILTTEEGRVLLYEFTFEMIEKSIRPSITHEFIASLDNKLLRVYTQNIDCLESKVAIEREKIVQLHGSVEYMRCTLCSYRVRTEECSSSNTTIECPECSERNSKRQRENRRSVSSGYLRPDIVLYDEYNHSSGDLIASTLRRDLKKSPDLIIVIGTSLKVDGIKQLLRDLCSSVSVKNKNRVSTLLINRQVNNEFSKLFQYQWIGECDDVVGMIEKGIREREAVVASRRRHSKSKSGSISSSTRMQVVKRVTSGGGGVKVKSHDSSSSSSSDKEDANNNSQVLTKRQVKIREKKDLLRERERA